MGTEAEERERRLRVFRGFAEAVPHMRALGVQVIEIGEGVTRYRLPYDPKLVGNPETGVIHGGAITALLDSCCGAAVFSRLAVLQPIATLDLRIDYLAPADPGRDVNARAECYKLTRNVAFVRAIAYHDDEAAP